MGVKEFVCTLENEEKEKRGKKERGNESKSRRFRTCCLSED